MNRRGLIGIAAAVTLVAVAAAPAIAGVGSIPMTSKGKSHGLHYMAGTYSGPIGGNDVIVTGQCQLGDIAVGGGASIGGAASKSVVSSSYSDDASRWFGEGQFKGNDPPFSVYPVCDTTGRSISRYVIGPNGSPGQTRTATANCTDSQIVVGGGPVLAAGNIVMSMPYDDDDPDKRPDDGWTVKGRITSGSFLSAQALCADREPGVRYVKAHGKARAHHATTLRPECPQSRAVSSGGFKIPGNGESGWVHAMKPTDSKADGNKVPDDRYASTIFNDGNKNLPMTAYAVCLKG